MTLRDTFGDIDIYVFDQLLRGRIPPTARVLDAGCGNGRNLVYLLRAGYDVQAVDADPAAVAFVRDLAAQIAPTLPATNFRVEEIDALTVPDATIDVVMSSAVLHFARDTAHFERMVRRMWRALAPGGLFICRLAASTGIESRIVPATSATSVASVTLGASIASGESVASEESRRPRVFSGAAASVLSNPSGATGVANSSIASGRYLLPDGSERYLVTVRQLVELTAQLGGALVDPIKSTIVQDMRCMTTWIARASNDARG